MRPKNLSREEEDWKRQGPKRIMNRRDLLKQTAMFGLAAGLPRGAEAQNQDPALSSDSVPVAFVISKGAEVMDFCGPWEVFRTVWTKDKPFFRLYTVAQTRNPVAVGGGMKIVPDYTFGTAPAPKLIVIPAQDGETPEMVQWIRTASKGADIVMSVCTGAFILARTGLLSGKSATTHHGAYFALAANYPDIHLKRGARWVDEDHVMSAGGISSGIDLALHVVEKYCGRRQAENVVDAMEYQGQGWLHPDSNEAYKMVSLGTDERPRCAVCQMEADKNIKSVFAGRTYYFCSKRCQELFDKHPKVVEQP